MSKDFRITLKMLLVHCRKQAEVPPRKLLKYLSTKLHWLGTECLFWTECLQRVQDLCPILHSSHMHTLTSCRDDGRQGITLWDTEGWKWLTTLAQLMVLLTFLAWLAREQTKQIKGTAISTSRNTRYSLKILDSAEHYKNLQNLRYAAINHFS